MPAHPQGASLPQRPNLRHLRDQARDLFNAGAAKSLTDAQLQIARRYGFSSWPELKVHVASLNETGQLKQAIDSNDLDRVKALMTRNPALRSDMARMVRLRGLPNAVCRGGRRTRSDWQWPNG